MKYEYIFSLVLFIAISCNKERSEPHTLQSSAPITNNAKNFSNNQYDPSGSFTATVNALNVRELPGLKYRVLFVIPKGDTFNVGGSTFEYEEINGVKGAWVTIIYKGQHGYAFDAYIRRVNLSAEEKRRIYTDGIGLTETNGIIEGCFSYPSEGTPGALEVCAENISTKALFCAREKFPNIDRKRYRYSRIFRLSVPAGTYHVYEFDPYNLSFRGDYNERVLCGLSIDCKSKKMIPVTVKANEITQDILPHDYL